MPTSKSGKGVNDAIVFATSKVMIVLVPLIVTEVITPVLAGVAPRPLLAIAAAFVGQVTYMPTVGVLFNKLVAIVMLEPAAPLATA